MKKISILPALFSILFVFNSCTKSNKTIIRMQHIEEGVSNPQTIEEYEDAIKKYEERVSDIQLAQSQIGIWHKIVGTRYLDKKMYGEALKSFKAALEYYPDNQNLYYYVGLCASYMGHTEMDFDADGKTEKRTYYYKMAEDAYLRAITIEPRYARALYAIGILYDFELMEPQKAVPHLETLLTVETKNTDAMILLARCYYETYEFEKAVEMYDKVISVTKSDKIRKTAEDLKAQVLETAYESK